MKTSHPHLVLASLLIVTASAQAKIITVNTANNPLDWSQLKNVPPPLAAGGYVAGQGISINGNALNSGT